MKQAHRGLSFAMDDWFPVYGLRFTPYGRRRGGYFSAGIRAVMAAIKAFSSLCDFAV